MLTYTQSIQLLFGLERLGMKFGLEGISRLLKELKNPHRKFPSIHVAGTNGKGSTASMLAAMLTAAGYKTGLYTSPHLVDFEERIRIGGRVIPRKAVAEFTSRLRGSIKRFRPTFFEATTAIAFAYFAQEGVDIAVIETGLGGRLDSTNVLHPLVCVITNIGLEHTEILGGTVEKIAYEKGGIIKAGTPCITGVSDRRALPVLKRICKKNRAPLILGTRYRARVRESSLDGTVVDFTMGKTSFKKLNLSLAGRYQIGNLGVALSAVETLGKTTQFAVSEAAIRAGLSAIQQLTGLSGRLEVIGEHPVIIADVAHNSDAMRNLCDTWKRLKKDKPIVVFGVVKDKDFTSMVHDLAHIAQQTVAVAAHTSRSRSASDVAAAFEREKCITRGALSVAEGIRVALQLAGNEATILITGSHFVVGEAMAALGRKRA